jgi:heme oxygenase
LHASSAIKFVKSLAGLWERVEVFLPMATHPAQYAHPEALVETDWLEEHLNDDGIRIVELNEAPRGGLLHKR